MIENALKQLLDKLDEIDEKYECAFGDTAVREELVFTILDGFVRNEKPQFNIDNYLAYSSDWEGGKPYYAHLNEACDLATHQAFKAFFKHPEILGVDKKKTTPQMRLDAFQDHSVKSKNGNEYDYYFGWVESVD